MDYTALRVPGLLAIVLLATACSCFGAPAPAARGVPAPLPDHPGNIFLAGESVTVPVAAKDGAAWQAVDYDGVKAAEGKVAAGKAALGALAVGWYELRCKDEAAPETRVAVGVLQPLKVPTPESSPISLDVAMAWFYPEDKMPAVANLCTLAGINWVRDRLSWGEMEPRRGEFAPPGTKYDASARIQTAAGLRVLQVIHLSPAWENPATKRFPLDLRNGYRFYREMARRWAGEVQAFEPWNEADIDAFGGHTGAEMASLQKVGYLGLKAGNPRIIACLNVFALPNRAILEDLNDNQAWPYFDTFNLHHYAPPDQYGGIYMAFRAVSAGRPLWVTEFALPVPWSGDEKKKEPADADLKVQAERVAQVFAASLHEGPQADFYFLLPHYAEGKTQFGIVRADLTPRPAFVALAAVGRLLADARPLGRLRGLGRNVRAFLFAAKPDGRPCEVLVAWATDGAGELPLPVREDAAFDHLGRAVPPDKREASAPLRISAPRFILLPAGSNAKFSLDPPPAALPRLEGTPSPVILQALWPQNRIDLGRSAYRVSGEKVEIVPVYAYNFSDKPVEGRFDVALPLGWHIQFPRVAMVKPDERVELALAIHIPAKAPAQAEAIRITGDFGAAGKATLSIRVLPEVPAAK